MRLDFLPEARTDLERLYEFLEPINPRAAVDALKAISDSIGLLMKNPEIGVLFNPSAGLRRWTVRFGRNGYVVEYFVDNDTFIVSRIWHTRETR